MNSLLLYIVNARISYSYSSTRKTSIVLAALVVVVGAATQYHQPHTPSPMSLSAAEIDLIFSRRQYCGAELEKVLFDTCHGLYYKKKSGYNTEDIPKLLEALGGGKKRVARGVYNGHVQHECCERGCTDEELKEYCLEPETTTVMATTEAETEAAAAE